MNEWMNVENMSACICLLFQLLSPLLYNIYGSSAKAENQSMVITWGKMFATHRGGGTEIWSGGRWGVGSWHERRQSSRLFTRRICVQTSKIGVAKAPLAPHPSSPPPSPAPPPPVPMPLAIHKSDLQLHNTSQWDQASYFNMKVLVFAEPRAYALLTWDMIKGFVPSVNIPLPITFTL